MTSRFMSVDPGTVRSGWAVFDGTSLEAWGVLECGARDRFVDRLAFMVKGLEQDLFRRHRCSAWALEWPAGRTRGHIPPELESLARSLRAIARAGKQPFYAYHPSTITAAVRPRGTKGWDRKAILRTGVELLYPELRGQEVPEDAIDAVAVAHTHLCKSREKELTR